MDRAGLYEFTLRRWPAETGHALAAGLADDETHFHRDAIAAADWGLYEGGAALPINAASVAVDARSASLAVTGEEDAARLTLALEAGPARLRAWFEGQGLRQSPYYVEARRLSGD